MPALQLTKTEAVELLRAINVATSILSWKTFHGDEQASVQLSALEPIEAKIRLAEYADPEMDSIKPEA